MNFMLPDVISPYVPRFGYTNQELVPAATMEMATAVGMLFTGGLASVEGRAAAVGSGPIRIGEVTTYKDFLARSVVGDNIEGHELWQHANLKANNLTTTRLGSDVSKNNPVIALSKETHQVVNTAQRELNAAAQTPRQNIKANAEILRNLKVAPNSTINRMESQAIEHAAKQGF